MSGDRCCRLFNPVRMNEWVELYGVVLMAWLNP